MKYKKELVIAIAVLVVTVGRQVRLHDLSEQITNKSIQRQEENRDSYSNKNNRINQVDYIEWNEFRNREKENGGRLYCMEDLMPELRKPEEWEDFF